MGSPALAEVEDGKDLYELAGPDSAFVRMVNLNDSSLSASLKGSQLEANGLCSVSRTQAITAGTHTLEGKGWSWSQELNAGEIYTVIVKDSSVINFSSSLDRNPMKAHFEVLNLQGSESLSVPTVVGKKPVFKDIPAESKRSRSINPLRVDFQVDSQSNGTTLDPIAFVRGKTTSLFVCKGTHSLVGTYTTE